MSRDFLKTLGCRTFEQRTSINQSAQAKRWSEQHIKVNAAAALVN